MCGRIEKERQNKESRLRSLEQTGQGNERDKHAMRNGGLIPGARLASKTQRGRHNGFVKPTDTARVFNEI